MSARGILAGVLRGHRRSTLGPAWDSLYHAYWDDAAARATALRLDVRTVLARRGKCSAEEPEVIAFRKAG